MRLTTEFLFDLRFSFQFDFQDFYIFIEFLLHILDGIVYFIQEFICIIFEFIQMFIYVLFKLADHSYSNFFEFLEIYQLHYSKVHHYRTIDF
jgi:hypothetical protein